MVDTLKGSSYKNMKELRPPSTFIRVMFAFDPNRMALMLCGGDKEDDWTKFYKRTIPIADALFAEHLEKLRKEAGR